MRRLFVLSFVSLLWAGAAASDPSTPVADAQRWMAMVDAGNYAESWSAAGTLFRDRVTKDDWANAVGSARKPLGSVVSRMVLKEQQTKTMPGAPDGDYDIIQFSTRFANKQAAVETVVLAHEGTSWRVDGYFVK